MKYRIGFVSNSSSEAFVCKGTYNKKKVEQTLHEMLEVYNLVMHKQLGYDGIFGDVFYYTKDKHNLNDYIPTANLTGKLIIMSASDNSIPYELFEAIEDEFNAKRYHLG